MLGFGIKDEVLGGAANRRREISNAMNDSRPADDIHLVLVDLCLMASR